MIFVKQLRLLATFLTTTILLTLVAIGCGGDAGKPAPTGRATFTVRWPEAGASRLIPAAASSIRVEIKKDGKLVASGVLVPSQPSKTFDVLPTGTLTATARAFPNADGTGVAQAEASLPLIIAAGQNTPVTLTMASTIDRVEVSPSGPASLVVSQTLALMATPKNSAGEVVLITPGGITWSADAPAVTVSANGLVTGAQAGGANVSAREIESGKSSTAVAVTVAAYGPVASVTVPASQFVPVGETKNLVFTARDAYNNVVTAPGAATFAVVSGSDKLQIVSGVQAKGLASGTAGVKATVDGVQSAAQDVSVTSDVAVSITPASATISVAETRSFSATVTGAANTTVTWSVQEGSAGGSVSASGLYTAPNAAGTYHVIATSQQDPSRKDTATVTVQSGGADITIR